MKGEASVKSPGSTRGKTCARTYPTTLDAPSLERGAPHVLQEPRPRAEDDAHANIGEAMHARVEPSVYDAESVDCEDGEGRVVCEGGDGGGGKGRVSEAEEEEGDGDGVGRVRGWEAIFEVVCPDSCRDSPVSGGQRGLRWTTYSDGLREERTGVESRRGL